MSAHNTRFWTSLSVVFFLVMAVLPFLTSDSLIAVLTLVMMFAFFGQAWNLMMGYVGQLSLGHGLYIGLGAYVCAISVGSFGVSPWVSILLGAVISALVGACMAWLGFRFAVKGIYFTLLTIAFAELGRLTFENWSFVGGSAGYFLAVPEETNPLLSLRGGTAFYYFCFLVLTALAFFACALLARSRLGYFWRAIREDEDAARAIGVRAFRLKIIAVMISAAMTSVGGSFYALMSGSLFPDTIMGMRFSIEVIIAPIIGGIGTLFGPVVGAFFVIPINEFSNHAAQSMGIFGLNILIYGVLILAVIVFLPDGIWPPVARRIERLLKQRDSALTRREKP